MAQSSRLLSTLVLIVLGAGAAVHAGGWVVVTLQNVPDHVSVGTPVTLSYSVRQHGRNLVGGLKGRIEARAGHRIVTAHAAGSQLGEYTATLALPAAGDWTIAIDSGFGGNYDSTTTTLTAIDAGAPAPVLSSAERGKRLFAGKGCISCHAHPGVAGTSLSAGPAFTASKRYQPDYLKQVLANPPAAERDGWQMPNLVLSDTEIASLVAFIRM